jgi:hypothetical protein
MRELAIRAWSGIGLQDPLPTPWQQFRSQPTLLDKKYYVQAALFPVFKQTPALNTASILHETLRDTIAGLNFGSTLELTNKTHLGLCPLAFAHQSIPELQSMAHEEALHKQYSEGTATVPAREFKLRKVPLAPGTPAAVEELVTAM